MDNKKVAKYALGFIGGKPNVSRYYNDDETKKIDIMTSESGVIKGFRHVLRLACAKQISAYLQMEKNFV